MLVIDAEFDSGWRYAKDVCFQNAGINFLTGTAKKTKQKTLKNLKIWSSVLLVQSLLTMIPFDIYLVGFIHAGKTGNRGIPRASVYIFH